MGEMSASDGGVWAGRDSGEDTTGLVSLDMM